MREDLVVRDEGRTGWAIRKGSPGLHAAIMDFYREHLVKQGVAAYRLAQYMKKIKQIQNPSAGEDAKRFEQTIALFRKYGAEYDFDPLMMAAQGFQESRLNQNAKSQVGAIGVMQVMPATGKELGVGDIRQVEANIHAGVKYMDQLMSRYFKDAKFDEQNRALFAFAAYNAGPGRIQQMRTIAQGSRARPRPLVQQRRDRHGGEGRHRNDDLRAQHLQVLRELQAAGRACGGPQQGHRAGRTRKAMSGPRLAPPGIIRRLPEGRSRSWAGA